ncbi:Imm51 family immunity protein [Microbulbifer sp. ZKSA002]|uniref:Imm51 family immunity protein n=1 Tax=Microbulbifer sp. ZKSA002 TaxID=3243388 RepID=UPI0040398AA8
MTFEPCEFVENTSGPENSLIFLDFEPYIQLIQSYGGEGGGYSWDVLIGVALKKSHLETSGKLRFDSESSMFSAVSENNDDLATVSRVVKRLTSDKEYLVSILKGAREKGILE